MKKILIGLAASCFVACGVGVEGGNGGDEANSLQEPVTHQELVTRDAGVPPPQDRCSSLGERACYGTAGCTAVLKYVNSSGRPCYPMGAPIAQDCRKVFDRCVLSTGTR